MKKYRVKDWYGESHEVVAESPVDAVLKHITTMGAYDSGHIPKSANDLVDLGGDRIGDQYGNRFYVTYLPRTQKARGMEHVTIERNIYPVEEAEPELLKGRFCRPCPTVPRHGFVDSRLAETLEEAKAVIEETRAADPEGEIITMPYLECAHSAIWTPGWFTIGPENDGATAGSKDCVTLPIVPADPPSDSLTADMLSSIGIGDAPYMEVLYPKNKWSSPNFNYCIAQWRNGPQLPTEQDFIPVDTTVTEVIEPEGSLLEWEEKVKHFAPGTVLYSPSLSSHYAVHCVINNVPVITSHKPEIGEALKQKSQARYPDLYQIRNGFATALEDTNCNDGQAAFMMLAALHNAPAWLGREDFLIGYGMGQAYRLSYMACKGEYRHKNPARKFSREWYYDKYRWESLGNGYRAAWKNMMLCFSDYERWHKVGSNFGGQAWYTIAVHAVNLFNAIIIGDMTLAMERFNILVNCVHNGGWAFNKFIGADKMSEAAQNPSRPVLYAGETLYRVKRANRGDRTQKLIRQKPIEVVSYGDKTKPKAAKQPKLKLKPYTQVEVGMGIEELSKALDEAHAKMSALKLEPIVKKYGNGNVSTYVYDISKEANKREELPF